MLRAVYLNVDWMGGALGLSGIPERSGTGDLRPLAAAVAVLFLVGR